MKIKIITLAVVFLLIHLLFVGCQKKTEPVSETKEVVEKEGKITYVETSSTEPTSTPIPTSTSTTAPTSTIQIHSFIDEVGRQVKYEGISAGVTSVREGPGEKYDEVIIEDKTKLQLYDQEEIIVFDEVFSTEDTLWYHVIVKRYDHEYTGYIESAFVNIGGQLPFPTATPFPTPTVTPIPTSTLTPSPIIHSFIDEEGREIKYKGIAISVTSVREGPGKKYDEVIIEDKTKLQLYEQEDLIILDEILSDEDTLWYHVIVRRYDHEYAGYTENVFVNIGDPLPFPTPTPIPTSIMTPTPTPLQYGRSVGIANVKVNVREGPGTQYEQVITEDKTALQLESQEEVSIRGEVIGDGGVVWYFIQVERNGIEYIGYVTSNYVSKVHQ